MTGQAFVINTAISQLMVTAVVHAVDRRNRLIPCRVLLDTCSTVNFITEEFATGLQLKKNKCTVPVGALNELSTTTKHSITVNIKSRVNEYSRTLQFLTVPAISGLIPGVQIERNLIPIPNSLPLADPEFQKPAPVQMLISSGTALSLLCIGQINLSPTRGPDLYLQKTQLGWVIGGSIASSTAIKNNTCLATDLTKFWEIEDLFTDNQQSLDEVNCEEHFLAHTTRNEEGRYVVALPFNNKKEQLGASRKVALQRLNSLERKFKANPDLKKQYSAVIQEYKDLGHMRKVNRDLYEGFYLPHHAVIKETSLTTKVRVVFDGSSSSASGISLNQALMVGPTIQNDVFRLLLRFRIHTYVLTGDIEKMYRQVLVREEDRKYQRILWYDQGTTPTTYELNTVTFGITPAPYLAIRCLHQLAKDEEHNYPMASKILKEDFYVDDMLTGASTIPEVKQIRDEMMNLLKSGGFNLRQCASNSVEVLDGLPDANINLQLLGDKEPSLKTLGIHWNSSADAIIYTVNPIIRMDKVTKRVIFSEVAKIFDPLGLLQPVIVTAKLIIQKLWTANLTWDESVPQNIYTEWARFSSQLPSLNNMSFSRKTIYPEGRNIELHGFCDASLMAYGACLYLRSTDCNGHFHTYLLCSKSRVSPVKKQGTRAVTIERLELCGAALLANLYKIVTAAINVNFTKIVFWSDSRIVLHWLNNACPQSLKVFAANRVMDIQSKTSISDWKYVPTHENPADLLTRGEQPTNFVKNSIWQNGPRWLQEGEEKWPDFPLLTNITDPEAKKATCLATTIQRDDSLLQRYSSIHKLRRVIAYCLRFRKGSRYNGPPSVQEMHEANLVIIKLTQQMVFASEIRALINAENIQPKSRLLTLSPFVDKNGILRVGGRIQEADISYDQRHPILLPRSHHVTSLIIHDAHVTYQHAGVQATLSNLRSRYWLLDGRNAVRKIIRQCTRCFRLNSPTPNYLMGNLPKVRVTPARAFENVGVDYCGPFFIKKRKYRNRTNVKVYVAVFICLSIKAVHLEVVGDMTTEAFLAALWRFVARRGRCKSIYSDNGSNFIGADNQLRELYEMLKTKELNEEVHNRLAEKGIRWHFTPPQSPYFGGIWEAAVKSFKHHLKRVMGKEMFTLEQFNTLVIEIEATLNSRPLTPLSSDPNDLSILTPGHFLIGESLTSFPEQDLADIPSNRLTTWEHLQKLKQHFWARWYKEYINELNIRHKWCHRDHPIKEGTIVVIKDDNLPPLRWLLGRVVSTHPGTDGVIRTVTVKTANSVLKRNVKKLAPLPLQSDPSDIQTKDK